MPRKLKRPPTFGALRYDELDAMKGRNGFVRTNKIRILERRNKLCGHPIYSGNPCYLEVWQQWWSDGLRGEWRDVEVVTESYSLPDGPTNRGNLRGYTSCQTEQQTGGD